MPRQARQRSDSGYLHLIVRGIGKQFLFEEREDYTFFLSALRRYCGETGVRVLAYCLMENHVHLLVRDSEGCTPQLMKKIGVTYAQYFNRKYERSGHLFQDRYRSEAVEDESYLLAVFRYILNNPQKAGLGPVADYEWSSYAQYGDAGAFVDTALLQDLIGDWEQYTAFLAAGKADDCMEYEAPRRDDAWAKAVIRDCLDGGSGMVLQSCDKAKRDAVLRQLKQKGLSVRQLERLTGINRGVIQKA